MVIEPNKNKITSRTYYLPRIVEMVGVAGTGKSTLIKAIGEKNGNIQFMKLPSKINYLPVLAKLVFFWLPLYLRKYRNTRWFTMEEVRNIGYLETWLPHIRTQILGKDLTIILDPGSIYWFSALQEFGPALTKDPIFQRWLNGKFDEWSLALDMIVWLEAPSSLLLQRVASRAEWHEAKYQSNEAALEDFERYRVSYEKLVAEINRKKRIKVFHYRTDQVTTEEMVSEILDDVNLQGQLATLSYSLASGKK